MKTNIALIGFMGTGKTAVGQLLAEKLDRKFLELDRIIEKQAGKSIPDIFSEWGEITFREYEIAATRSISGESRCVIACGGGLVLNKINVDRLKENGLVVYLAASPSVILKRVQSEAGGRPLLEVANPLETISELVKYRRPLYDRAADITVNTSRLSPEVVTKKIISKLKENESFNL